MIKLSARLCRKSGDCNLITDFGYLEQSPSAKHTLALVLRKTVGVQKLEDETILMTAHGTWSSDSLPPIGEYTNPGDECFAIVDKTPNENEVEFHMDFPVQKWAEAYEFYRKIRLEDAQPTTSYQRGRKDVVPRFGQQNPPR